MFRRILRGIDLNAILKDMKHSNRNCTMTENVFGTTSISGNALENGWELIIEVIGASSLK